MIEEHRQPEKQEHFLATTASVAPEQARSARCGDEAGSLPSALDAFDDVLAPLGERTLCLFLDFDGTLAPIVARPELAALPLDTREIVARLSSLCPVCLMSGRALEDLQDKVGLDGVYYAAEHGCEIVSPTSRWPRLTFQAGGSRRTALQTVTRLLETRLATLPGLLLEAKRFSTAVHYRLAPEESVTALQREITTIAAAHPELRVTSGKMLWEIRAADEWGKGQALLWLLERLEATLGPCHPLALGDDLTDEDMFAALGDRGSSIIVGLPERPTRASHRLENPHEVSLFLARLTDRLALAARQQRGSPAC